MLVRDILPPQKIKRIAKEEVLGIKTYKSEKSKYLNLSFRAAIFFLAVLYAVFPASSFEAYGEEWVVQAAQESFGAISSGIGEGVMGMFEGIVAGVGDILIISEPTEGDNFESLPMEDEDGEASSQAALPAVSLASANKAQMTKMEKQTVGGKDRFLTRTPAGDEIGFSDADESSDKPYLELERWQEKTGMKIKIPYASGGSIDMKNDRLKMKNDEYEVEVYPRSAQDITEDIAGTSYTFTLNDEGGIEFDIILDSVPENNVFEFPVESEGLAFYYQDALDPEHPTWADRDGDGRADIFRPEIVVGSYAVYYAAQEGFLKSEEEGERYKTGKAFHIYRPRVTDSGGRQVWGELGYDNQRSVLSVTISADWLASASYPVRVDPNIGTTSVGASAAQISSSGNIISNGAIAGANGTVIGMSAYVYRTISGSMKCNVYNSTYYPLHSGGTANGTIPSSAAWVTMPFTAGPDISSSESYYLAVWNQNSYYIYADSTTSHTSLMDARTWGTSWPSPATTTTWISMNYSLYATYVESKLGAPGVGISGGGMLMF